MSGTVGKELEERGLQVVIESGADTTRVFNTTIDKHAGIDSIFLNLRTTYCCTLTWKFVTCYQKVMNSLRLRNINIFLTSLFQWLTCLFENTVFEILKADDSYLKKVEEYLTDIINNPITVEKPQWSCHISY